MASKIKKVQKYLIDEERTPSWLARKLDVSPTAIHYWFNKTTKPTKKHIIKIKELTGIQI